MKFGLVIFAVLAIVAYATAAFYPVVPIHSLDGSEDSSSYGGHVSSLSGQPQLIRHKRFTCDLLSFSADGVSGFNHAACAAKCLAKRHFGGHCDGPECKCTSKKW